MSSLALRYSCKAIPHKAKCSVAVVQSKQQLDVACTAKLWHLPSRLSQSICLLWQRGLSFAYTASFASGSPNKPNPNLNDPTINWGGGQDLSIGRVLVSGLLGHGNLEPLRNLAQRSREVESRLRKRRSPWTNGSHLVLWPGVSPSTRTTLLPCTL